jgi:hypothetical protein
MSEEDSPNQPAAPYAAVTRQRHTATRQRDGTPGLRCAIVHHVERFAGKYWRFKCKHW